MNLYCMISGCLFFLVIFGVLDRSLSFYGLNKWLLSAFLLLSCVFSLLQNLVVATFMISLNFIIYFAVFVIYLVKIKNVKNYFKTLFCSLIVIAVLMCYSAFDLADFEYSFVGIYVYVAIALGIIFSFVLPNIKTTYCGVVFGSIIFDLIYWKFFNGFDGENYILMPTNTLTFIFVTVACYCLFNYLFCIVKAYKNKKKQETTN